MLRRVLPVVLLSLLLASAALCETRTSVLDTRPGLDKHITMNVRAASIREILDTVEAETKVRLRPDRGIAEDKATIYVKDKPARDVLRALAHCFNLCWVEVELGDLRYLKLFMDRDSDAEMRKRHYDDYLAITDQFDKELEATAQLVRSSQKQEFPNISGPMSIDEQAKIYRSYVATQESSFAAMSLQFLKLSESQRKDLFSGKEVVVSGSAIDSEPKEKYPEAEAFHYWIERSLAGYLLQGSVQPAMAANDWSLIAAALFDDTRYDKMVQSANAILLKDPSLDKELPAPKPEDVKPLPSQTPVGTSLIPEGVMSVPKPGEGSGATPTTMSDDLLPLAKEADIPIVAQYLSEYLTSATPTTGGIANPKKISEKIADLSAKHRFAVERDGDFLLAKSLLWHRLRNREVPEETIRRWQKEITGLPAPTFNVTVEMGSMSWEQVRGIIANSKYWFGIDDPSYLARGEYALKLYASLTPSQQNALWQGTPISAAALNSNQQHIFMQGYEFRARPTYREAQDPGWAQTAAFSMTGPNYESNTLFAVQTGVRVLDYISLDQFIPEEQKTLTQEELNSSFAIIRPPTEDAIAKGVPALKKQIQTKYPEIPIMSVGIYTLNRIFFRFKIADKQGNDYSFSCPVRVDK